MSSRASAVLVTLLFSLPGLASAADLKFVLEGFTEYDSNAFRSSDDEEDDVLFRIRPSVEVSDERGQDLRYRLRYQVPFEFAADNSDELNDIDHQVFGRVDYHVSDRSEWFVQNSLRYLRSGLRTVAVDDPASGAQLLNTERERIFVSNGSAGTTYRFSPRLSGNAQLSYDFFDPERPDRARNYLVQGNAGLGYVLTPKHSVGGDLVVTHQDFEDRLNIVGSTTQTYGVRGRWIYRFDETTSFQIAVGPSIVRTEQDDADMVQTQRLVPFRNVSGEVRNFVDIDGVFQAAPQVVGADSIVVGNFTACPNLPDGTPVIPGESCALNIVLDSNTAPPGLIDEIRNATTTVNNADPDGERDTSVNVFGEVTLRKDWAATLNSAVQYTRQQGGASGLGGAVIRDSVSLSNYWIPSERWQFLLRGDWSLRQSTAEQTQVFVVAAPLTSPLGGGAFAAPIAGISTDAGTAGTAVTLRGNEAEIDTMRWGVSGRATHRFTRNTSGYIQLTYNQQDSDGGTLGNVSDFENFLALLAVRYVFEPVKLW